jgi:hypothetical protein
MAHSCIEVFCDIAAFVGDYLHTCETLNTTPCSS